MSQVNVQILLRTIIAWFHVLAWSLIYIESWSLCRNFIKFFSNENSSLALLCMCLCMCVPLLASLLSTCKEPDIINYMPTTDSTHSLKLCVILGRVYFLFQREKSATNTNLCHEMNANEMKNHAHVRITCECSYVWQLHRHTGRYNRDEIQRKDVLWCLRSQVNKINLLYLGHANWLPFSFTLFHPPPLPVRSLVHSLILHTYI